MDETVNRRNGQPLALWIVCRSIMHGPAVICESDDDHNAEILPMLPSLPDLHGCASASLKFLRRFTHGSCPREFAAELAYQLFNRGFLVCVVEPWH